MARTASADTVRVLLAGREHTYALDIAGLGDHLASGGTIGSLHSFTAEARAQIKRVDWVKGARGWVTLDESGLAYHVEVTERSHKILAAAPMPGVQLLTSAPYVA